MRLVFGISGASGLPLALKALSLITSLPAVEVHLIVSNAAYKVFQEECKDSGANFAKLAAAIHDVDDLSAPPASGSWKHEGMIICPCSMNSLAAISHGLGSNLLHRSADVTLKERRPLILATRETPLNLIHLKNMCAVTEAGAVVMPFVPAFYADGGSMKLAMTQFTGRMLDLLKISHPFCRRWKEEDNN